MAHTVVERVHHEVRAAWAAGLCVVPPAEDGTKAPIAHLAKWGHYRQARPTDAEYQAWYPGRTGLGLIKGQASGNAEAWDFDDYGTYVALVDVAIASGLGPLVQLIEDGYCDETPGNGRRWLLRCEGGVPYERTILAKRPNQAGETADKVLIELPEHTILAPSDGRVHPTGKPYVRLSGGFPTIATITTEDRAALIALAKSFDQMPLRAKQAGGAAPVTGDRTRPGDDFNRRAIWADILRGWTEVYARGAITYWRRPDKREGHSATTTTTTIGGNDLLYVFSSSTPFQSDTSYSKFAAYAVLEHGGDFGRAARALGEAGYGDQRPPPPASAPADREAADERPAERRRDLNLTDTGNAEYFAGLYSGDVRFDHRRARWLLWRGHRWQPDADAEIHRLAKAAMRKRFTDAGAIEDSDARARMAKWAIASESRPRLDALLYLARSERPIADTGEHWDADGWLLGVPNGVIDLRTGILRPGRREDRITMQTFVPYDPHARCDRWERFVAEVFVDPELVTFVHRAVGYSLAGDTAEQCLFLGYGGGSNGKGTFTKTIKTVLGDYAYNMPFSTVEMHQRSAIPNDLAALVGRRFVVAAETNDGTRLNEARIKALTGCDPITARFLHAEYFEFEPVAKFWLSVNHKPVVRDDSHGFWRRMRLLPFLQTFDVNPALADELRPELPGILAWAIRGCLAWQRQGLSAPAIVTQATHEYESDSDVLAAFLAEACELDSSEETGANDLRQHYRTWADRQGLTERERLSATMFGKKVAERFKHSNRRAGRVYYGIGKRPL